MKVDKRANFCIFIIIAILALGLSNITAGFTADYFSNSFSGINETEKMIALDEDNFTPNKLNTVYEEKKVIKEVNESSENNGTNSAINNTNNNNENQNSNNEHSSGNIHPNQNYHQNTYESY